MTSKVVYDGQLRTTNTHLKSGNEIITDAPTDNNGKGQAFSPTDLVSTALANCMLTVMGIRANAQNLNIDGATAEVTKIMSSNPRRIAEIIVDVTIPANNTASRDREMLEKVARTCPVALSIHPDTTQTITFTWK